VAGELYDYMTGLIIIGMIFTSAVIVVPNLSYVNLLHVDQQQLRNVALETMKGMLLDTGYPLDWGSKKPFSEGDIQRFGLAYASSDSFYVLDPDKVQRLDTENKYGSVKYSTMRDLLNLRDYGFSLSIIPTFNVTTIEPRGLVPPDLWIKVKVSRHDGRPLANAAVHTTFLYSIEEETTGNVTVKSKVAQTVFTDPLGICEVDETLVPPAGWQIKDVIAVLRVTVADIATVVAVYQSINDPKGIVDIWSVGDDVTVAIPTDEGYPWEQPQEADWVCSVAAYYGQEDIEALYSGGTDETDKLNWGWGSDFKNWTRTIPGLKTSDPTLLIFAISCVPKGEGNGGKGGGRRTVLIAGPSPSWRGFRVLNYGGTPRGTTVKVERNVIISGMTYLAEMILWKESP